METCLRGYLFGRDRKRNTKISRNIEKRGGETRGDTHTRVSVSNSYLVTWRNKIFQTLATKYFARDNFQRKYHVILSYSSGARPRFNFPGVGQISRKLFPFRSFLSHSILRFQPRAKIINCFVRAASITFSGFAAPGIVRVTRTTNYARSPLIRTPPLPIKQPELFHERVFTSSPIRGDPEIFGNFACSR